MITPSHRRSQAVTYDLYGHTLSQKVTGGLRVHNRSHFPHTFLTTSEDKCNRTMESLADLLFFIISAGLHYKVGKYAQEI